MNKVSRIMLFAGLLAVGGMKAQFGYADSKRRIGFGCPGTCGAESYEKADLTPLGSTFYNCTRNANGKIEDSMLPTFKSDLAKALASRIAEPTLFVIWLTAVSLYYRSLADTLPDIYANDGIVSGAVKALFYVLCHEIAYALSKGAADYAVIEAMKAIDKFAVEVKK